MRSESAKYGHVKRRLLRNERLTGKVLESALSVVGQGGTGDRRLDGIAEKLIAVGSTELLGWAAELDAERLWAMEDCRQLTGWLERQLLGVGEELVRVPPKLTVPERRAGRTRGKSDPSHARARARAPPPPPYRSPRAWPGRPWGAGPCRDSRCCTRR